MRDFFFSFLPCGMQYIICLGTFRPAERQAAIDAEKFIAILYLVSSRHLWQAIEINMPRDNRFDTTPLFKVAFHRIPW